MSVHPDRGRWVVRWRVNGTQRARRFKTEAEAIAFDEGVSGGTGKAGSSTPNVYPYETSEGTRWRYSHRDSRARLSTKRGFLHEITPYLDACGPVYRPLAELLVGSGMRISEALALHWDDVDFPRRVIRVYRSAKREGEGSTKGKRFRAVQVGPELVGSLRDLRARSAETMAADLTHAPVFAMPVRRRKAERGRWGSRAQYTPVDRNTVSRDWHKQALERAGCATCPFMRFATPPPRPGC